MPLNRLLYSRLNRKFGEVKIRFPGVKSEYRMTTDYFTGKPRIEFVGTPGEYYCVNCPFCHDRGKRLYVLHLFGQRDQAGRLISFMAICYNENCLADSQNLDMFLELLEEDGDLQTAHILPGKTVQIPDKVEMPGYDVPVGDLPPTHKAVRYLLSRRYDIEQLHKFYKVHYCVSSWWSMAQDRLVFPVYFRGELRGWQCRYIGELPWHDKEKRKTLPPKYWSYPHMKKSLLLYNYDSASKYKTMIGVEGPTDVIALGGPAVCTFGDSLSDAQRSLILSHCEKPGHAFVLYYDPDSYEKKDSTRKLVLQLTQLLGSRFVCASAPPGLDPGKLRREVNYDIILDAARKAGVKLSFSRVADA